MKTYALILKPSCQYIRYVATDLRRNKDIKVCNIFPEHHTIMIETELEIKAVKLLHNSIKEIKDETVCNHDSEVC